MSLRGFETRLPRAQKSWKSALYGLLRFDVGCSLLSVCVT